MPMSKRITLLPNVNLTYLQTEKYKTDYVSLALLRPLCRREAAKNSLLTEVLLQGSEKLPDMQAISDHLDELYGAGLETMNLRRGEVQIIGLIGDCVSDRFTTQSGTLQGLIDTMGELLLHPALEQGTFREDYVQIEAQNLIRAIQAQINDKRSYASRRLLELMFSEEAYGIDRRGTEEEVAAITPEDLYAHYQRVLKTSRVEVFYMGAAREEEVLSGLRRVLRELPREEPQPVGTEVRRQAKTVRELSETMDVTQGKLLMGFRTDCIGSEPDYPAMLLLNGILGGTVSSKLFQNVREKLSLCYYAGSGLDKTKGVLTISSGIAFEDYDRAKAAVLEQLDACRTGDISQSELESARSYLVSTLQMAQDSPGRRMELALGQALDPALPDFEAQLRSLEQVTVEQVCKAAHKLTLDTIYFMKGDTPDAFS